MAVVIDDTSLGIFKKGICVACKDWCYAVALPGGAVHTVKLIILFK